MCVCVPTTPSPLTRAPWGWGASKLLQPCSQDLRLPFLSLQKNPTGEAPLLLVLRSFVPDSRSCSSHLCKGSQESSSVKNTRDTHNNTSYCAKKKPLRLLAHRMMHTHTLTNARTFPLFFQRSLPPLPSKFIGEEMWGGGAVLQASLLGESMRCEFDCTLLACNKVQREGGKGGGENKKQ